MKQVAVILEVELGVFTDDEDLSAPRILEIIRVADRSLMVETPVQIVVTDTDTGLITTLIPIGDTST